MKADELVERLRTWASTRAIEIVEARFHEEVLAVLQDCGVVPKREHSIENGSLGKSRIDLYVPCDGDHLLIEIKATGDWRRVAEATWQLFQASMLLAGRGVATERLVVCGTPLADPNLSKFLRANDTAWVTAGKVSNT